ncbi:hypothetical protein RB195_021783 [Necator americanus]|uniref:Uncharacterized protein n=1 Tax=Necator americanus TaxID=51031 RepID=A0ABR1ECM2_NECAM
MVESKRREARCICVRARNGAVEAAVGAEVVLYKELRRKPGLLTYKPRLKLKCTVTCDTKETSSEITGTLLWVRMIHDTVKRIAGREDTLGDKIVFPDSAHIIDTIISGDKTLVIPALSFTAKIVTGYVLFWTWPRVIVIAFCRCVFSRSLTSNDRNVN